MQASREIRTAAPGWLSRAIIAGFVATSLMTITLIVAYYFALALGDPSGGLLARWLYGLTHNPVVTTSRGFIYQAVGVHLAVGLVLALAYARFFEPVLPGPSWLRGVLFALVPWVLSLVVLLPLLGGGFLGLGLQAGPLPILGNLILHLVYGASLGWAYAVGGTVWGEDIGRREAATAAASAERSLAVGIVAGLVVGGVVGWLLGLALAPLLVPGVAPSTQAEFALAGALFGAAAGAIVGPYGGLGARV